MDEPHRVPERIDVERRAIQSERVSWLRRGILAALAGLVVLALLGGFGQKPSVAVSTSDAASLRVTAPTRLRGGLVFQVKVEVHAIQAIRHPLLRFSSAWFDSMTTNAIVPQPAQQISHGADTLFELGPMAAGSDTTWWLYFQVNPTNVQWRRPETVELLDGGRVLARIAQRLTVFP